MDGSSVGGGDGDHDGVPPSTATADPVTGDNRRDVTVATSSGADASTIANADGVATRSPDVDELALPAGADEAQPPGAVRRRLRTLTFGRRHVKTAASKGGAGVVKEVGGGTKKRSGAAGGGGKGAPWSGFKFNYRLKRGGGGGPPATLTSIPEPNASCESCVCTGYRRTEEHHLGAGVVFRASEAAPSGSTSSTPAEQRQRRPPVTIGEPSRRPISAVSTNQPMIPFIDLSRFNPDDYPIEDWDERARAVRARELEEGVEPPPGYRPAAPSSSSSSSVVVAGSPISLGPRVLEFDLHLDELFADFQNRLIAGARFAVMPRRSEEVIVEPRPPSSSSEAHLIVRVTPQRTVHTQVDYIHCLVPDLREITDCSFYWGKMDRYEAERLLERRPEGTFLLRDSAQEEFLFSVSFRRYGRSLHARIEQFKHRFSFDSHDPGVFASDTVCGLIDHYKDPSCCMFFEPMLTLPLHRTFPFPLQHLCRAAISEACTYDGINSLRLPKSLKGYLKEYHYKQRVRVRRFEVEQ